MSNFMWNIDPESLKQFFPEIEKFARRCKSADCMHIQEQDCAVKTAVREKSIRKDRYESFISIMKNFNTTQKPILEKLKVDPDEIEPKYENIEAELRERFKVYVTENQKSLNIENILIKLSQEEKIECLTLISSLSYLELLDISKNGKIYLNDEINDLPNLKKLRIDENAITTQRDKDFVAKLTERGIKVMIYSI